MPAFRRLPAALALTLLGACAEAPSEPPSGEPAADSAFALLARLDAGAVGEAYRRLDRYAYTAEVRLTTLDAGAPGTATRTVARRPTGDGVEERLISAEGDVAGEAWPERLRLRNPLPALLPDEPAFLADRSREDYRFTLGPDTTVGGLRLRVVEAALRPEAEGDQALRHARFFLHPHTEAVLGVEAERRSTSALFDEALRARVLLQPGPDGTPIPALAVVETAVDVPGEAPRRLRLEQRVRDVRAE